MTSVREEFMEKLTSKFVLGKEDLQPNRMIFPVHMKILQSKSLYAKLISEMKRQKNNLKTVKSYNLMATLGSYEILDILLRNSLPLTKIEDFSLQLRDEMLKVLNEDIVRKASMFIDYVPGVIDFNSAKGLYYAYPDPKGRYVQEKMEKEALQIELREKVFPKLDVNEGVRYNYFGTRIATLLVEIEGYPPRGCYSRYGRSSELRGCIGATHVDHVSCFHVKL